MANEEQLAILRQGVEVWNKWREANPDLEIDLSGAELTSARQLDTDNGNVNLVDAYLNGADLSKANLSEVNFTKANLFLSEISSFSSETKLNSANLSGVNLSLADLGGADLGGANLSEANLSGARLNRANLSGADLSWADLVCANLIGANLRDANLSEADFTLANLSGANLRLANLNGANLRQANLSETILYWITYNRKGMLGKFQGIRVDSCYGDAIFKRDAQDQDYIDTLESRCSEGWRKILFNMWGWTDFGRSMPRVGGFALSLVMIFGTIYRLFPSLVDYGNHRTTPFTPYYFSFVTYTTLGFGDVTGRGLAGEILVALEVVLGYLTLGLLLAILANTVARRS